MRLPISFMALSVLGLQVSISFAADQTVPLTALDLGQIEQAYTTPKIDKSAEGNPISIGGEKFEHGLGSHADSRFLIAVNGATRFTATVGVDDEVGQRGAVRFRVIGDGKTLFDSGLIAGGDKAQPIDLALDGVKQLLLLTSVGPDGINYCHADWANAQFVVNGEAPKAVAPPPEPAEILTPPPPHTPRINGAKIFGVRPGSPILYSIAATGDRPMNYTATGLPDGATFDGTAGRFGGAVQNAGTYVVHLTATNALGSNERDFKLVVGDTIALTPMMGWNSWYGFANRVSDDKMRSAADMLVSTGLIDHGFSYVCIDDYWQQAPRFMTKDPSLGGLGRDATGNIVPNPRFPDMKALTAYIHSKGLKAGVYSSPGPFTCGGALGSFQHEAADAAIYADWGFDLLKYDWCSYKPSLEATRSTPLDPKTLSDWGATQQLGQEQSVLPYALMGDLLRKQHRDIFYLMCQYGMGQSWTWADTVGGNSARTTGDITDTWGAVTSIGFGQFGKQGVTRPGYWSDPDMLMVGVIGLQHPHPTHLTPNEQYSQVSLWAILPAPLLFGAHLDKLDDFTKSLLTNDEVIAIDQDALGKQAVRVVKSDDSEIWAKDLDGGDKAVAIFNRGEVEAPITVQWSDLGLSGQQRVRDLWRQKDLGLVADHYSATVARHGVVFIRLSKT